MEQAFVVSASELRGRSAELLDGIENGRVLIRKHGEDRAYLISARELRSLKETIAILEDRELLKSIKRGIEDMAAGNVRPAEDVFAEIESKFKEDEA